MLWNADLTLTDYHDDYKDVAFTIILRESLECDAQR